jgi:hypothetical protein
LVGPNDALLKPKFSEESSKDLNGRGLAFREENPYATGGSIHNQQVSTVPIVGQDDAVGNLVRAAIVNSRRPHEPKVHEVFATTFREAFSRLPGRLLPDVGLLLEVDVPERVIFENGR